MIALDAELRAAGVPAIASGSGRVALGGGYRTALGQWVIEAGSAEWIGTGDPTPPPSSTMIATAGSVTAAHVPTVRPPHIPQRRILRALAKLARGKTLTAQEEAALDRAESAQE